MSYRHELNLGTQNNQAYWAIAYHTNSRNPRALKWYRVSRMINVDGMTFELYWYPESKLSGYNLKELQNRAREQGVELAKGVYCDAPAPRKGNQMVRR